MITFTVWRSRRAVTTYSTSHPSSAQVLAVARASFSEWKTRDVAGPSPDRKRLISTKPILVFSLGTPGMGNHDYHLLRY